MRTEVKAQVICKNNPADIIAELRTANIPSNAELIKSMNHFPIDYHVTMVFVWSEDR